MTRPTLSVGLANYGETFPPGEWKRFVDLGRAAEDAGVDRVAEGIAARARRIRDAFTAAGRDPDGLQVQAPIRMAKNARGEFDIAASMASVPGLVAGGATDIIVTLRAFAPEVGSAPAVLMRLREEFDAVNG